MLELKQYRMAVGQLKQGFEKMPRPCPAAVLFGLANDMSDDQVINLNWAEANKLRRARKLTEYSCHILDSQPRHLASNYVFWIELKNKPMPLFGLDGLIFEHFGLLWSELQNACEDIIWVDGEADAEDFFKRLKLTPKAS